MDYLPALSRYDKGRWEFIDWDYYYELKLKPEENLNRQISFEIIKGERMVLKYNPWKKGDPKPERELVFIKEQK